MWVGESGDSLVEEVVEEALELEPIEELDVILRSRGLLELTTSGSSWSINGAWVVSIGRLRSICFWNKCRYLGGSAR